MFSVVDAGFRDGEWSEKQRRVLLEPLVLIIAVGPG